MIPPVNGSHALGALLPLYRCGTVVRDGDAKRRARGVYAAESTPNAKTEAAIIAERTIARDALQC